MLRTGQNLVVLRVGGWVAGENGNKANSASVEVEVEVEIEAELGKTYLILRNKVGVGVKLSMFEKID